MSEFHDKDGALDIHKLFDAAYELKKKHDREPPEPFLTIPIRWYRLADVGALRQLRREISEAGLGEEWASDIYHHVVAGVPYRNSLRQERVAKEFVEGHASWRHAFCTDEAADLLVGDIVGRRGWPQPDGTAVRITPRALAEELL